MQADVVFVAVAVVVVAVSVVVVDNFDRCVGRKITEESVINNYLVIITKFITVQVNMESSRITYSSGNSHPISDCQ